MYLILSSGESRGTRDAPPRTSPIIYFHAAFGKNYAK